MMVCIISDLNMLTKEDIQNTTEITYDVLYLWFVTDVGNFSKKPHKTVTKLKQIKKILKLK